MNDADWQSEFHALWNRSTRAWNDGRRTPKTMFRPQDNAFLQSIGCSPQELFDFVEDHLNYAEPDLETVLAVTALRREYFLDVQQGRATDRMGSPDSVPPKDATAAGFAWLPRIIAKARLKLRGELPPDLMYGCGGDRAFLARIKMTSPAFLRLVRDHEHGDDGIIEAVKRRVG